jgi:hypothetical protein
MPAELLEELLLLTLPVLAHLRVEVAVEVGSGGAATLFDGGDDGLLVSVSKVALRAVEKRVRVGKRITRRAEKR